MYVCASSLVEKMHVCESTFIPSLLLLFDMSILLCTSEQSNRNTHIQIYIQQADYFNQSTASF